MFYRAHPAADRLRSTLRSPALLPPYSRSSASAGSRCRLPPQSMGPASQRRVWCALLSGSGGRKMKAGGAQPGWGWTDWVDGIPKVARASQPWALLAPFGPALREHLTAGSKGEIPLGYENAFR